jgi:hypothetical protein
VKSQLRCAALAGVLVLAAGSVANADIIRDLGGGWQIIIATAFQDHVDVVTDAFNAQTNTLVVEKFAEFTQVDPFTGMPGGISVTFRQILPDAQTANHIVITDEALYNFTGMNWTGFRMQLIDSGQATFDPAATAASGLNINPFTAIAYSNGNTQVDFSGGVVPNGGAWYPGISQGGIVINVNLAADGPVQFSLKETPIPTPGAAALMGVGGIVFASRRKR